jgi:hypothetical protein
VNTPCALHTAINGAAANDVVTVLPGSYTVAFNITAYQTITVQGLAGQPRPKITVPSDKALDFLGRQTVRHLDVTMVGNPMPFLGELMEDVVVRANASLACILDVSNDYAHLIRNSVCTSANQAGLTIRNSGSGARTVDVRNVTVSGTQNATFSNVSQPLTVRYTNTILRPGITINDSDITVRFANVNYGARNVTAAAAAVADDGPIYTDPPVFVNAAAGDFHQDASSPTINHGASGVDNGAIDFDGDPREIDGAPDVGADEYVPAPSAVTAPATDVGVSAAGLNATVQPNGAATTVRFEWGTTTSYTNTTSAPDVPAGTANVPVAVHLDALAPATTYHYRVVATSRTGTSTGGDQSFTTAATVVPIGPTFPDPVAPIPDTVAPVVGALTLSNRTFKVGKGVTATTAAAKTGSAFRFAVSEDATAKVTIEQAVAGVKRGKRCTAPPKSGKGKRCTRYLTRAVLTRKVGAGRVSIVFTGRIGSAARSKSLKAGRYRATVVATDAAGNRSSPASATFKIVTK